MGPRKYPKEREKLAEILDNDENLEALIDGRHRENIRGTSESRGVLAATNRRVFFVSEGEFDRRLAQLTYNDIESVTVKDGLFLSRISLDLDNQELQARKRKIMLLSSDFVPLIEKRKCHPG